MSANIHIYPCDRGTGTPMGLHHYEESTGGSIVCRYCGAKPMKREPAPITDAQVEAAARGQFEHIRSLRPGDHGPYRSWEEQPESYHEYLRSISRAALEAARDAS